MYFRLEELEKFTAEHQEGFAVDNELRRAVTSFEVRQVCILRVDRDGSCKKCGGKDNDKNVQSDSHSGAILPNLREGCLCRRPTRCDRAQPIKK
jgi:hypothetical protein